MHAATTASPRYDTYVCMDVHFYMHGVAVEMLLQKQLHLQLPGSAV